MVAKYDRKSAEFKCNNLATNERYYIRQRQTQEAMVWLAQINSLFLL